VSIMPSGSRVKRPSAMARYSVLRAAPVIRDASVSVTRVAYLRAADNSDGLLVSHRNAMNHPVISSRNAFSTPRSTRSACI
jgi:hypothetical protein